MFWFVLVREFWWVWIVECYLDVFCKESERERVVDEVCVVIWIFEVVSCRIFGIVCGLVFWGWLLFVDFGCFCFYLNGFFDSYGLGSFYFYYCVSLVLVSVCVV